ncbi:MAG: PSD1 and planctomycete cytochrome C domain-containing protein [Planctomycetota bacterium]
MIQPRNVRSPEIPTSILRGIVAATVISITALTPLPAHAQEPLQFNRDIRPILSALCFQCHGFDQKTRQGGLRLDTRDGAVAEHDGLAAIRPGHPETSELLQRITSSDPDIVMPPPESKKSITPAQVEILRRWIAEGAPYQQHWAFEPPRQVPSISVHNVDWIRNPIDAFILQRLEQANLQPQPEASRETLIRRVALTLTGLPPAVTDVERFLADSSPSAFETMLNQYLQSPRYGEEQARYWLDAARYADTHGLHLDNEREMWAWRDWVIDAFNRNLPFDQFTIWQLAGDLLPNPTLEQRIATGFNRCNVTTSEGGAINEEWVYRYAVDRTSTTMQTWMGLTAGCAVCHDHKYDPITTRDFYSMYSFFYSAADPGMDGNIRNTNPFTLVPTAAQQQTLDAAPISASQTASMLTLALTSLTPVEPAADAPAQPVSNLVFDDLFPLGHRSRNTSRDKAVWVQPEFPAKSGERVLELAFGGPYDLNLELPLIPVVVPDQAQLTFWIRVDPLQPPQSFSLQIEAGRGRKLVWDSADDNGRKGGGDRQGPLPAGGQWTQLTVSLDHPASRPGDRIRSLQLALTGGRVWIDAVRVTGMQVPAKDPLASFNAWWLLSKGTNPGTLPPDLNVLLNAGPKPDADPALLKRLQQYWMAHVQRAAESPVAPARIAADAARERRAILEDQLPGTFTFADMPQPRQAHVMLRGQYDRPADAVEPAVPAIFPGLREASGEPLTGRRPNRLDLARWLVSPDNPLTARVTVNRIWQQVFGTGLVATSDDFGTRGDLPSHPELLDWLAVEFRRSGWDIRALYRLLLTSSTFRQDSAASEALLTIDPANRLLARGPRFRLDAEQLRDNALWVSGLMDLTMGGRGVRPYQPADIWEPVGYENSNTRFYLQDHGSALYRRSVYTFIKRTAPPPFMTNFDAPNREQFCARRERSNTPLQALQLMNDVQHFEAARALAQRILLESGPADHQRLLLLYRIVLSRSPADAEFPLLQQALQRQREHYQAHPDDARTLIRNGESISAESLDAVELAAWTMLCNLVLNLDETVCRN